MPPCTSRKKCIRAALRFDSDNKNLSRFPVDFTGTSGEVFPIISQREADASLSTELGDSITPSSDAAVEADSDVAELLLTVLLAELPPPPGSMRG